MARTDLEALGYEFCEAALLPVPTPHGRHQLESGLRCPGAPERDDRARTFNPKGHLPQ